MSGLQLLVTGGKGARPPPDSWLSGGAPSYRAVCWSGCRWARADGPGGKHGGEGGVSPGSEQATRALISPTQPPPCGASTTGRGGPRPGGSPGSRSGTGGLNSVQGSQPSPPPPQLLFPHLHLSTTSASGRRPGPAPPITNPVVVWLSLSLGLLRPRHRLPQSQSGRALHPGFKPHPPRGSEWLSSGRAGEEETANGRREAGSRPRRGGGSRKGLQWRRDCGRRRPRADPGRFRPGRSRAVCSRINASADKVLAPP